VPPLSTTRMRLERLGDERARLYEKIEETNKLAEDEQRDTNDLERQHLTNWRERAADLEQEIGFLATDLQRAEGSLDVSALLRAKPEGSDEDRPDGPHVYRTFARYARDLLIVRYPTIAAAAANDPSRASEVVAAANERLQRTLQNTTTSEIEGLLPPQHMAEILDIIDTSRPVVSTARRVDLNRGKLTYPKIAQRPEVLKQNTEKTQAGTKNMQIDLEDMSADTYLGGGNLSWQTINWSTPDALALWFQLAAEAYARQTETAACASLEAAAAGTASPSLGTAGTEDFAAWRKAAIGAIGTIYTGTGGRARTNTLYLAADQFFALAALSTDAVLQMSGVGNLDIATMTGTFSGLRVVGSYGFQPGTRIIGDSQAFLVGETPGAPVEMRAVEPAIGGMEVGVIGAFQSKVFDPARFTHLS
jgi:HK97 family phage major capsid protein